MKKVKSRKTKKSKKIPKVQNAGKKALRFIQHFTNESPKILGRIASFDSSASEIRDSIILPLADMIMKLNAKSLSAEEKEYNNFKFILFWPELVLKLQGFFRKAALNIGFAAITKTPQFYKRNKNGDLDQLKRELRNLILVRFWKNIKRTPLQESAGFIKRLKTAIEIASDFSDQPQLQSLVKTVIVDLGFDELQKAISLYVKPKSRAKKK